MIRTDLGHIGAAIPLVVLLVGCGHRGPGAELQRGRTVFARSCSSCHSLTGDNTRAPAGDLALSTLSVAAVASFARIMPAHLTTPEVQAVAVYVHAVESHRAAR
jgi:mono/diheme cytochrome c family protein